MRPVVLFLVAASALPQALRSQETPPAGLATVEVARSRTCVGALDRLSELNLRMQPLGARANRLRQLDQAIALEDSTQATPFGVSDVLEAAVRDWFIQDMALGARYAENPDSALAKQRADAKTQVRQRLAQAMDGLKAKADSVGVNADEIDAATVPCQGSVFVRSAVQEECRASGSKGPLCEAAADTARNELFRFVDAPAELWDMQELRPWSDPGPLQVTQAGGLAGARSAARTRLGNISVAVSLAPLIQPRAQMDSARAAEFDANLDSLGVKFDVPGVVMAPVLEIRANVPPPIGEETHYLLHFGDLTSPDLIWTTPVGQGGLIQAAVPLSGAALNKLQNGEEISFTAVKVSVPPAAGQPPEGEFVFGLSITNVNQTRAVSALLAYIVNGGLAEDLRKVVPPAGG